MKMLSVNRCLFPVALSGVLFVAGCNNKPATNANPTTADQNQPSANQPQQTPPATGAMQSATQAPPPAPVPPPQPVVYTIPAGTRITVRMGETIDSKTATEGESFPATVATPVVVDGKTVIREGASASGTVVATKNRGRFKGAGYLELRLDTVRADGRTYPVASSTVERVEKGKGKRSAAFIGGGGGLGALIGGIAGGGKGALIGGLAGAGAGTAGTAFTDNKPITIPAETVLTFRLEHGVTVR